MQIETRAAAAAAGRTQYFTGKPCKNGHLAARYTQSGTCSTCIADATRATRSRVTQAVAGNSYTAKRAHVVELAEVRIRAYAGDAETVRGVAAAYCMARYPTLSREDVTIKAAPTDLAGGTALYRVRVPLEHAAAVRETANALLNARGASLSQFHANQAERAAAMVGADAPAAPGEWAFA